jgi:hypothetical protein
VASELLAVVGASRPMLGEEDSLFWETLRKHYWIEAVREEIEFRERDELGFVMDLEQTWLETAAQSGSPQEIPAATSKSL